MRGIITFGDSHTQSVTKRISKV